MGKEKDKNYIKMGCFLLVPDILCLVTGDCCKTPIYFS